MKKLFIGNLPFTAKEEEIRGLFEKFGGVSSVTLINDRETGRPRGFGFVEMANDKEAEAAVAGLDGSKFGGRDLRVNEAREREERRDSGRSFGGGGRGGDFGGGGRRDDRGGSGGRSFGRESRPEW